jgi:hypothetical protein
MKYVLLIHESEAGRPTTKEAGMAMMEAYRTYTQDIFATGRVADAAPLESVTTSTSVRVRDKKRSVIDGPFAETREQLGGYYALDAKDEEEALAWAAKIPSALHGAVEVRKLADMQMPSMQSKVTPPAEGTKEYMLLIYDSEQAWAALSEAQRSELFARYGTFTTAIRAEGQFVAGEPLAAANTAKIVRVRDGKRTVTDGPFAETREQLGGYYRIRAHNLDQAVAIASRIPSAEIGTIEIRPLMPMVM